MISPEDGLIELADEPLMAAGFPVEEAFGSPPTPTPDSSFNQSSALSHQSTSFSLEEPSLSDPSRIASSTATTPAPRTPKRIEDFADALRVQNEELQANDTAPLSDTEFYGARLCRHATTGTHDGRGRSSVLLGRRHLSHSRSCCASPAE